MKFSLRSALPIAPCKVLSEPILAQGGRLLPDNCDWSPPDNKRQVPCMRRSCGVPEMMAAVTTTIKDHAPMRYWRAALLLACAFLCIPVSAPAQECRFLLDNCAPTIPPESPPSRRPANSTSPVDAVRAFYTALSRADGNSASAMVIPEKRNSGSFNPTNLGQFYSSLREPLKILSVESVSNDVVRVTYRFVRPNGSACLADATVTTVVMNGQTLIQRISANC
jgi:hypothetical protein